MPKAIDLIRMVQRGEAPPPPVAQLIGFPLTDVEPGRAVIAFDADGRHANPMGTLHGGVLCDIADAAMGMAYAASLDANETFTTLELKINFLKPVRKGRLVATGRVVKGGRTVGLVECDVLDDKDRLARVGRARRRRARLPTRHAGAHDVRRRHGRRRRICGRARARRRPACRRQRAGRARVRHRIGHGGVLHDGVRAGRAGALPRHGRQGRSPGCRVLYSRVLFGGALAYWLFNTLGSVIRGTGNIVVPASVIVASSVLYIALSPALILGWGPLPRFGIAGAATASVASFTLGSLALATFLFSRRSLVRPTLRGLRLQPALFLEILRVGAPGSLNTGFTNLTVVVLTSLVGPFGGAALAGYGLGARLEYLQIPIVFGLGSALVTMIGTSVGAGNRARGLRVAWAGTAMAAAVTGVIGGSWPRCCRMPGSVSSPPTPTCSPRAAGTCAWSGRSTASSGPGLALYFASQGAGRLLWPLVATFTRLMIAGVGGWLTTRWLGGGLTELFAAMAVALMTFGMMNVAAVRVGSWRIAPKWTTGIPSSLKRNSLEGKS